MKLLTKMFFMIFLFPLFTFAMTSSEIEDIIKKCVDEGHTQGMVIGIIEEGGTKFYKYGQMGIDDPRPMDENVLFETGSITKIFTSLLLAEMERKGEVNLDDHVENFLPDHVKVPDYNGTKITLEHLSVHTAGFPYIPENFVMNDMYNPFNDYSVEDLYSYLNNYELKYKPGTQYQYSNVCKGLLGHVLGLRLNTEFKDLLVDRLLKPLGMENSVIEVTDEMQKNI